MNLIINCRFYCIKNKLDLTRKTGYVTVKPVVTKKVNKETSKSTRGVPFVSKKANK